MGGGIGLYRELEGFIRSLSRACGVGLQRFVSFVAMLYCWCCCCQLTLRSSFPTDLLLSADSASLFPHS